MATTNRRAAGARRLGGEPLLFRSPGSRKHRNANGLARQGAEVPEQPSALEIQVPLLALAANVAAALHARSNGSTVSIADGNLLGRSRFAVSIYPERSVALTEVPTRDLLFAFAILNADLLCRPGHALGTWFDSQRNRHVLDVVVFPESLDTAIRLGVRDNQRAIFDLKKVQEVSLIPALDVHAVDHRGGEN